MIIVAESKITVDLKFDNYFLNEFPRSLLLVFGERMSQIYDHGYSLEGDKDQYKLLIRAGLCYIYRAQDPRYPLTYLDDPETKGLPLRWLWPWANEFWKPSEDPIKNLTKGVALIMAAIDSKDSKMMKAILITEENKNRLSQQYDMDEDEVEEYVGLYLVSEFGETTKPAGYLTKQEFERTFEIDEDIRMHNGYSAVRRKPE